MLKVGNNRITSIDGLAQLQVGNLRELLLGDNDIVSIRHIAKLHAPQLVVLSLCIVCLIETPTASTICRLCPCFISPNCRSLPTHSGPHTRTQLPRQLLPRQQTPPPHLEDPLPRKQLHLRVCPQVTTEVDPYHRGDLLMVCMRIRGRAVGFLRPVSTRCRWRRGSPRWPLTIWRILQICPVCPLAPA